MDNIKFGKFIKDVRREKGLTQKQLADILHVSDKAVSKWENGIGFPDIKLLEPLAEVLEVSLLELMQSERNKEQQMDAKDVERVVADTVAQSEKMEERRLQMWKIRLLLIAGGSGIIYLVFVGLSFILRQSRDVGQTVEVLMQTRAWYENPVTFYVWVGLLTIGCAVAAFLILWKTEHFTVGVRIGRHRIKGILTIVMDMLVVLLLHTYMTNIASNQEQFMALPDAIPVNAYLSNNTGTNLADIMISERIVEGLENSSYVKDLNLTVRLKAGVDQVDPYDWKTLDLYLCGVNRLEAAGGMKETSIVWNTGMDASIFESSKPLCVVSKTLMEERNWKLGDHIKLCQYYYYRDGYQGLELFLNPLEDVTYEIAGYSDMEGITSAPEWAPPDILVPFEAVRECHHRQELSFAAHSADFMVADTLNLNDFKQEMKDLGLGSVTPLATEISYIGTVLNVNDSTFINAAGRLRRLIDTVSAFFPFLLVLIVCVGYLVTLLLLSSRKQEMALLRSIGVSRGKCFWIFFQEQLLLAVAGISVGSLLAVLLQGNHGGSSVLTGCLVGIFYMLGNGLALYKLLKVSVMEALFQAD
ncbi:MAG: helix-turn-helix domain-containing protein [Lachnospiraceae bacterium]|nr:helix-turn-helix domain-containing protein [Lachnospiraceae bacterium]